MVLDRMPWNRWRPVLVVLGGVMVHLTLGTVYTFGNLTPYLTSYLRKRTPPYDADYGTTVWIYSISIAFQGLGGIMGGLVCRFIGVKLTVLLGSLILSFSVGLTYFSVQHSFAAVMLTYGVMYGLGIGFSYSLPISCAMQWFPEHKGLVGGIVVSGFGGSAFIFIQIQTHLINPNNLAPNTVVNGQRFFTQDELLDRFPSVFLVCGVIYMSMQLLGIAVISEPLLTPVELEVSKPPVKDEAPVKDEQDGYDFLHSNPSSPKTEECLTTEMKASQDSTSGCDAEQIQDTSDMNSKRYTIDSSGNDLQDIPLRQVLKHRLFYTLWLCLLLAGLENNILASVYKDFGQMFIKDDKFLALTGAFGSLFNCLGRIFWGFIADRFSFKTALLGMNTTFSVLLFTFISTSVAGRAMFFTYICLLFGCAGGGFSLMSLGTERIFGSKNYKINYGIIFTALSFGGILAAVTVSSMRTNVGWFGLFSVAGSEAFLALLLTFSVKVTNEKGEDI